MNNRSEQLKALRPEIARAEVRENMTEIERFQNACLRPILKFQNDLFIAIFQRYIEQTKNRFYRLPLEQRPQYIAEELHKNKALRQLNIGVTTGLFSLEEYDFYTNHLKEINRRVINMIIQRLQSQLEQF